MAVVRFSDRPPSVHEAPPREPSEEDFFEKYLRNFQDPPGGFAEPCDLEDLPRLPSFRTPYEPEETLQFPKLDLPPASALHLPDGSEGPLEPLEPLRSQWRLEILEMEDMVPHERQSMMAESEYGPAPTLEFSEPRQAVEEHVVPPLKLPLPPPPPPPPPPVLSHADVFQEAVELPLGVSNLQVSGSQETIYPPPQPVLTEHTNLVLEDESLPPQNWCGLWNLNCKEGKCTAVKKDDSDKCVRCRKALDSFMDHQCPKCSASFCVKCVSRFPLNWFRCKCGDQEANQAVLRKNLWMIKAYHTTYQAFNSLGASLSSLSSWMPCRNQETAQSLNVKDSTITQLHGGQVPPDMVVPGDRTRLPVSFAREDEVQMPMPKRKKAYRPGNMPLPPPPPPPPHGPSELPHLLGRRTAGIIPMNYYETDPFQTRLPGEMSE